MPGPGFYLFGDEERKELLDVMESGYLSRYGLESDPRFKQKVVTYEKEFAEFLKVEHCVATNSGTGALMTCLAALGIGAGDEDYCARVHLHCLDLGDLSCAGHTRPGRD